MLKNISWKIKLGVGALGFCVLAYFVVTFLVFPFMGRTGSRLLGKDHRQVIKVDNLASVNDIISVSFDKRGPSTVKDVTFKATDGFYYTREFKDGTIFEGIIRWVPHDMDGSALRTRAISRWTGGSVDYRLPEDFKILKGVDITYVDSTKRVKNLMYISIEGLYLSKEYREGIKDRFLEGWLEVKPEG